MTEATHRDTAPTVDRLRKAELHVHLDGSLRPATLLDLARAGDIDLPADSAGALADFMRVGEGRSLVEYLERFEITLSVMQTPDSLQRIAFELAEDLAAEQAVYAEIRYSPVLSTRAGMDLREAVEAPLRGLEDAASEFGIATGLVICALRNLPAATSIRLAELAAEFSDRGVVGFDLAGPEAGHPPGEHSAAFQIAREAGLGITVHAGEAAGPESIEEAIRDCHAVRIGHGARLPEDPALFDFVRENGIAIETCLTSNVQTGAVARFETHPLRSFFDAGIPVSINTDNRLMSGTTLTREYELAKQHLGFTIGELNSVTRMAIRSGFLPPAEKARALQACDDPARP